MGNQLSSSDYHYEKCFLCGFSKPCGPHLYDVQYFAKLQMLVCKSCRSGNYDGIGGIHEEKVEAHLVAKNITNVRRTQEGLVILEL